MVRRKKRVVDQQWISVAFDICPNCSSTPEIFTYSKRDELFYNLDPVRCSAQCGVIGSFSINSNSFKGSIEWDINPFKTSASHALVL